MAFPGAAQCGAAASSGNEVVHLWKAHDASDSAGTESSEGQLAA